MTVRVTCNAKLNLLLKVYGKRPDGFHDIISAMQSVDLADSIEIEQTAGTGLEISCTNPDVPTDEKNLAWKAVWLMAGKAGRSVDGLRIRINKGIPVGAGLAGGSADCAGTLVGLRELWSLDIEYGELIEMGAQLGSDVPFCLVGGSAMVKGRGEHVDRLPVGLADSPFGPGAFLLVVPPVSVKTGTAYDSLDESREREARKWDNLNDEYLELHQFWMEKLSDGTFPAFFMNDFEGPVFHTHPEIAAVHTHLRNAAGQAILSGSGGAMFAYYPDRMQARIQWETYQPVANETAFVALPTGQGVIILK